MSSRLRADEGEEGGVDGQGALPPMIIRNLNPSHLGGWSWSVVVDLRDTQNMLETLYLSKCLQKGPNSPPEPINLEEWDHVSQRKAEDSKEEWTETEENKRERGKEGWSKTRRKWQKIKLVSVPQCCLSSDSESSNLDFELSDQYSLFTTTSKISHRNRIQKILCIKCKNGKDLKVVCMYLTGRVRCPSVS